MISALITIISALTATIITVKITVRFAILPKESETLLNKDKIKEEMKQILQLTKKIIGVGKINNLFSSTEFKSHRIGKYNDILTDINCDTIHNFEDYSKIMLIILKEVWSIPFDKPLEQVCSGVSVSNLESIHQCAYGNFDNEKKKIYSDAWILLYEYTSNEHLRDVKGYFSELSSVSDTMERLKRISKKLNKFVAFTLAASFIIIVFEFFAESNINSSQFFLLVFSFLFFSIVTYLTIDDNNLWRYGLLLFLLIAHVILGIHFFKNLDVSKQITYEKKILKKDESKNTNDNLTFEDEKSRILYESLLKKYQIKN